MFLLSILARFAYRRSDPALLQAAELKDVSQTANGNVKISYTDNYIHTTAVIYTKMHSIK
jgi:lipopolysaccharide assembly outer membrane protein LptD (OstA)